jgi:hypothetical protein
MLTSLDGQLSSEFTGIAIKSPSDIVSDTSSFCVLTLCMKIATKGLCLQTAPAAKLRAVALGPVILHDLR